MAANPSQKDIVDAVTRQLQNKDLSQQAVMVLQRATAKVLERIKQGVSAQIKDDSTPIVETFGKNVSKKLSAMTQQWADGLTNDLLVYPEGTRNIFRDGKFTTVIVEQPPQVRHLNIDGRVYLLALPYVQFYIAFQEANGVQTPVAQLNVTCTKKSIGSLDQAVYHTGLPNYNNGANVCMGSYRWPQGKNMTDAVNDIISGYWQSEFNGGHAATFLDWEAQSKKDALYGIDKKKQYSIFTGQTVRSYLVRDTQNKTGTTSIVQNLKQEIITAVGLIGGDLQKMLTEVDLQTENREKVHVEALQGILKEIIVQAYTELWEYLQQQLRDERAKLQQEMKAAADKLKNDFNHYMEQKKKVW